MAEATTQRRELTSAELGALAHLYRGEIYRSTIWRTRLDTTTNWAVVTLGVALSITFSSPSASPLPLVLVGILILLFLMLELRRYRYFNVWRARARWLERHLYAPMLKDGDLHMERDWQKVLAEDYWHPHYHIGFMTALGRRIRRNYLWILSDPDRCLCRQTDRASGPTRYTGSILAPGRCRSDPRGDRDGSRGDLCRRLARYCAVE